MAIVPPAQTMCLVASGLKGSCSLIPLSSAEEHAVHGARCARDVVRGIGLI